MASGSSSKACSDARLPKLRKLNELRRRCPHMTASAMSALLHHVEAEGVPELHGRSHVGEASEAELAQHTAYGPLLEDLPCKCNDGSEALITVVNVLTLLQALYGQGGAYSDLLELTCARFAVLNMIMYYDEIVPGDPLGYANKRKFWVCYISFREFGARILANEAVWLPVLTLRTAMTKPLCAGISQVCKKLLLLTFANTHCDVQHAGLYLKASDGHTIRVCIKLGALVQDGAAHKMIFCLKGDAGTKFCALCRNLVALESDILDEDGEPLLVCSVVFANECDFADDNDVFGSVDRLEAKKAELRTKNEFAKWQQAAGLNYEPEGLLACHALRPILNPTVQYMHDWMHTLFVTGVFQRVVFLVIAALASAFNKTVKDIYKQLLTYVYLWRLPADKGGKARSKELAECFAENRADSNKKAKIFRCSASHGLGLYHIMYVWLATVVQPTGLCGMVCEAFFTLAIVIDLLKAASAEGHTVTPEALGSAIHNFHKACIDCGWRYLMTPKFHWLVHFPAHLANHGFLISCFVHERFHKLAKRYGTDIQNTSVYEHSLLKQVLCHVLFELRQPDVFDVSVNLIKPHVATKAVIAFLSKALELEVTTENCQMSRLARVGFGTAAKGDVVLLAAANGIGFEAAEVWFHAKCNGKCISLVSIWTFVEYDEATKLATWNNIDNPWLIDTSLIQRAVMYRYAAKNVVYTLL